MQPARLKMELLTYYLSKDLCLPILYRTFQQAQTSSPRSLYFPYWYFKLVVFITWLGTHRIICALFIHGLAHHVIMV